MMEGGAKSLSRDLDKGRTLSNEKIKIGWREF